MEKFTGDLRKMLTPARLTQEERWNPEGLDEDTRIVVQLESGLYETEPCSTEESDWGFVLYTWEESSGVFWV